jgi:hypothetical protein
MKCLNCDADAIITKHGKQSDFCSMSCRSRHNSKNTIIKRKATNIKKYGVDNPSKSIDIINTRTDSNIKKYGVSNPFKLAEVRARQQASMIEKYGVPFACQNSELKSKQTNTWEKNYNGNPQSDYLIRELRRKTLLERYGVEHPILCKEIELKIRETCKARYGNEIASKADSIIEKIRSTHLLESTKSKIRDTCVEKYGATSFQLSLIPSAVRAAIDNEQELILLLTRYGLVGLSKFLDISIDTLRSRIKQFNIQITFKSSIQQEVIEYIKSLSLSNILSMQTDTRKIISPKELDIYFDDILFAIEVNGSYWHSELNNRGNKYHIDKLNACKERGIDVFFVWEHLWNTKKDIIKSRISNKFNCSKKIYARKCEIRPVSKSDKVKFLEYSHLQGDCGSSVEIGLYIGDTLYSVMTFGKPRFNSAYKWELLRFSTILGTTVIGGASKLFKHFIKTVNPENVISYSDKQYGSGAVYGNLGFEFISTSPPSYYYTNNYKSFENRMKYQKHKLSKLLDNFNPGRTEWENMQDHGYDRIWDCGVDVWAWTRPVLP